MHVEGTTALKKYSAFRQEVQHACEKSRSLKELTLALKSNPAKMMRIEARKELQDLYNLIAEEFELKEIPVYLPVRKKIAVRGRAVTWIGTPKEIRIYPIKGAFKAYDKWKPSDIDVVPVSKVLEILMHEAAHVFEACSFGVMSHGQNFVDAYNLIAKFVEASPYGELIDPSIRLWGAPTNSVATAVRNAEQRNLQRASAGKADGAGCLGSILLWITFLAVSVSLFV
jgi:hypothetical protein